MATGFYLQDYPNPSTPQYGWLRVPLGQPGQHLSGVIGVHTSEAPTDFEGPDFNAENNAAFIGRRTDYGSYHTSADADSIVPLVHPAWAAWADMTNNVHAMSVSGCLQAARWLEMTVERRRAVVINMGTAAALMVRTAVADGYLAAATPAVRISPDEAISGSRPGFYGHGETNPGTRYDPGAHFDWDLFLASYASAVGGGSINYQGSIEYEEDPMATLSDEQAARLVAAADRILGRDEQRYLAVDPADGRIKPSAPDAPGAWAARSADVGDVLNLLYQGQDSTARTVDEVSAAYHQGEASAERRATDLAALVGTLSPAELVVAIPDNIAQQVADELARRLGGVESHG